MFANTRKASLEKKSDMIDNKTFYKENVKYIEAGKILNDEGNVWRKEHKIHSDATVIYEGEGKRWCVMKDFKEDDDVWRNKI